MLNICIYLFHIDALRLKNERIRESDSIGRKAR